MKTEAKALPSMASNIQYKVTEAIDALKIRKERGDDIFDCYEMGFLKAMQVVDKTYHLDIDFQDFK